ncbi:MAG: hypothetical protein VR70_05835 [Rhodospirillaceae bacterium BRH_c57]|nr:MAG: hypothetical protein VR70_05835 [Rhodospirillaceae bacterium BRH_c57]
MSGANPLLFGPIFALQGVDVIYTPVAGQPTTIRVLDKFRSAEAFDDPGVWATVAEIHAMPTEVAANPDGGTIEMHDNAYRITSHGATRGPGSPVRLTLTITGGAP